MVTEYDLVVMVGGHLRSSGALMTLQVISSLSCEEATEQQCKALGRSAPDCLGSEQW